MAWIDVRERLPRIGEWVFVHGAYTPDDVPKPKAALRSPFQARNRGGMWDSIEWRGSHSIWYWWEEEKREDKHEQAKQVQPQT